jgi:hypothetical protein
MIAAGDFLAIKNPLLRKVRTFKIQMAREILGEVILWKVLQKITALAIR